MAAFGMPGGLEIWAVTLVCLLLFGPLLAIALVLGGFRSRQRQSPPAGWLVDPSGRHALRYWDGSSWTDDVSDAGIQSVDKL